MEDPFWEYFLEEDNFKDFIKLTQLKEVNPEDLHKILPKNFIEFEGLIAKKWTINYKRENAIRTFLYFSLKHYPKINYTQECLKILYLGLLEYAGYIPETDDFYYKDVELAQKLYKEKFNK